MRPNNKVSSNHVILCAISRTISSTIIAEYIKLLSFRFCRHARQWETVTFDDALALLICARLSSCRVQCHDKTSLSRPKKLEQHTATPRSWQQRHYLFSNST